jgi:outer membrane protein assembly factor BamB
VRASPGRRPASQPGATRDSNQTPDPRRPRATRRQAPRDRLGQPQRVLYLLDRATGEFLLLEPVVRAIDMATGDTRWEYRPPPTPGLGISRSGLLATAGDLVFGACEGQLFALDAKTGSERWREGGDADPPLDAALRARAGRV